MIKLKDIASKCHVSVGSVSKALNGGDDISPETVKRIKKTALEMGYIPNANARILKTNRSYDLGVLFVDKTFSGLKHEYFSSILNAFKKEAESRGYDITFITDQIMGEKKTYLDHVRFRRCDGVVIASVDFKSKEVQELLKSDIPVVTIDYLFDNRTSILSDNQQGTRKLVNYAYSLGHRKIAYIHGENNDVTQRRIVSYYSGLKDCGLKENKGYVKEGVFHSPDVSRILTNELLSLPNPPTCIIYPDDYSMLGGISEIEKEGKKVPDDISIIGYDGINLSRLMRPVFTTYVQDSEAIGKTSATELIDQIENPLTYANKILVVDGKIQLGATVKKID